MKGLYFTGLLIKCIFKKISEDYLFIPSIRSLPFRNIFHRIREKQCIIRQFWHIASLFVWNFILKLVNRQENNFICFYSVRLMRNRIARHHFLGSGIKQI